MNRFHFPFLKIPVFVINYSKFAKVNLTFINQNFLEKELV